MISIIKNASYEVFRFDGWNIGMSRNEMKSQVMNGDYYDITNHGEIIATFNLADMTDDYRNSRMTEEQVAKEIVGVLVELIEKAVQ